MCGKDRDLEELMQFQQRAVEFCERISELGRKLKTDVDEASVSLQDDVSKKSMHRAEDIADKLVRLGQYGQQQMIGHLSKTRAELDAWNRL